MAKRPTRYGWLEDGEWFWVPSKSCMMLACCDCGLAHRIFSRVTKDGRVRFATQRDDAESARIRRRFRKKLSFTARRNR